MNLFGVVLPVFLIIALGYALRLRGFLGEDLNEGLSRLVFYVAAPALLFHSTSGHAYDLRGSVAMLAWIGGITGAVSLAVYALAHRARPARRGVLAQSCHRSNTVFIGLPIVMYAFGDAALGVASIVIGFMVLVENFFAVLVLTLPQQDHSVRDPRLWSATALRVAKNPLILACVAGVLWSLTRVRLPVALDRALEFLGTPAAPLGLLCVGAGLRFGHLRTEWKPVAWVSAVRLILHPALIYFALRRLGMEGVALAAPVLIMACPTAVVSYIMAREMQGDAELAAGLIVGTTAISILTLFAWLAFLRV